MLRVLLLALFMFMGVAHATPAQYVGTPVFYGKYTPKVAPCTYAPEARYGFCGWANYPEEGQVGITYDGGETVETVNIRLYDEVICVAGVCKTNYNESRGSIDDTSTSYWYVPRGYYLSTITGTTTAVKYGNGPFAGTYPIANVIPKGTDFPDGRTTEKATYAVTCNVAKECQYLGRPFKYRDLARVIPTTLTTQCDDRFCYIDRSIVGLNPRAPK